MPSEYNIPKIIRTDQNSRELWQPRGWRGRFYKLFNHLEFTRKEISFSDDIKVIQTELQKGHIKVRGKVENGGLVISFYEGSGIRISGKSIINSGMALSYSQCSWDSSVKAPAFSVALQISPRLTNKIISGEINSYLMSSMLGLDKELYAIILPITQTAVAVKKAICACLNLIDDLDDLDQNNISVMWMIDDITSLLVCMLDEIASDKKPNITRGEAARYHIAQKIEQILWQDPTNSGHPSISLDYLATYFYCSRRTIQTAIVEQFGIGFTELKRCIRLHQINSIIESGKNNYSVSAMAYSHDFDHLGRFSKYYKEMFGDLPSKKNRKAF